MLFFRHEREVHVTELASRDTVDRLRGLSRHRLLDRDLVGQRRSMSSVGRYALGERLGGFIYGTIIVLAVLVAGAKAYPDRAGRIAPLVVITCVAFLLLQ